MKDQQLDRRKFLERGLEIGTALSVVGATAKITSSNAVAEEPSPDRSGPDSPRKTRVGVIGCGSVSHRYLPHLAACPFAELVSTCDIIEDRAISQAQAHRVPHHYPNVQQMLAGADFDLLVNLTDMQEHEHINREAIAAGKHVWSEKPIANSLAAGQELLQQAKLQKVRVWGAPVVVSSPQFAAMSRILQQGKLGRVAAAHADYGHTGPSWSSFFYEKGGGSLPDLGVYNLTTLTGLLGPAKSLVAMVNVITPTRIIDGKGEIRVTEEDNAMVVLEHANGTLSHVQSGFNYFNPHGHEGRAETRHTISIVGTEGSMGLVGYDWEPLGVDIATVDNPHYQRQCEDASGYVWQQGASLVDECLATGKEPLFTPEHALHVVEIICAARESQSTGRRIPLTSTFRWPIAT
ncbi:MAG: Gfo/Idh/MocA family oxidoreductase [Pirellulaceae bacterium]|nr:Gfo/Idh/MocA family oxidoreductase [Planctomycetales bacterium]